MAITFPAAADSAEGAKRPAREGAPRWLREPLLHFAILGALLFAADRLVAGSRDDPHTIYVDRAVDAQAIQAFESARGRKPDERELHALRRVWLDNEVLYREGLALGVDKGDPMIRDRVIFKALEIVGSNLQLPPIDDAGLRAWFEKNRAKYDEPMRIDFQEAVPTGERSEAAVRALVARLESGAPGDIAAGLRVFKGRPRSNVVDGYGEAFAADLESAPAGHWRAIGSTDGWRAILPASVKPARPAQYDAMRDVVRQDWVDATMSGQRSAAVAELARKYRILVEERR